MANQLREGYPDVFFSHMETSHILLRYQIHGYSHTRLGKNSDLIKCIKPDVVTESFVFGYKIFDGMALVQLLNPLARNRYIDYIKNAFICYIKREGAAVE